LSLQVRYQVLQALRRDGIIGSTDETLRLREPAVKFFFLLLFHQRTETPLSIVNVNDGKWLLFTPRSLGRRPQAGRREPIAQVLGSVELPDLPEKVVPIGTVFDALQLLLEPGLFGCNFPIEGLA
jgi:hypothetical protein